MHPSPADDRRRSLATGARRAAPLGLAAVPFGLVYGVAVASSTVAGWVGVAASWIVLAGAAQLSVIELVDDGASAAVVIATALVINARFALYSAALAPSFRPFPTPWRIALPYLLTDQAASLQLQYVDEDDSPTRRRWFFVGAALTFSSGWWAGTVAGFLAGGAIPDEIDIAFAVPAMFIALLVPTLGSRPHVVAAVVAGAVAVAAAPLPAGLNICVAALAGIVAGRASAGAST